MTSAINSEFENSKSQWKSHRFNIPKTIEVGYRTIEIEVVGKEWLDSRNLLGLYEADRNKITLVRDAVPETVVQNTILHEIMHAIYDVYHLESHRKEEDQVNAWTSGLHEVMKRNRDFFQDLLINLE